MLPLVQRLARIAPRHNVTRSLSSNSPLQVLTEEEEMFKNAVAQYADEQIRPHVMR